MDDMLNTYERVRNERDEYKARAERAEAIVEGLKEVLREHPSLIEWLRPIATQMAAAAAPQHDSWQNSVDWPGEERQGYVKRSNGEEHP